jgi:hypothetical protein
MFDVLSKESIERDGLFRWDHVRSMMDDHISGKENNSHRLWALMVFKIWQSYYVR